MSPKVWLITGASSGLALAMTKRVLTSGHIVVATSRNIAPLSDLLDAYPGSIIAVQMDVTNADDVRSGFAQAMRKFGKIDVVLNCAGLFEIREIENEQREDLARSLFEVNFWGAMRVAREAVKAFRDGNPQIGGILLNVSSWAGVIGIPGGGFYTASKHALEGLSKSLAMELLPEWNIKICVVQVGAFRTPIHEKHPTLPIHPKYDAPHGVTYKYREMRNSPAFNKALADPDQAMKVLYDLVNRVDIDLPFFVPLGPDSVSRIPVALNTHLDDVRISATYGGDLRAPRRPSHKWICDWSSLGWALFAVTAAGAVYSRVCR